MATNNNDYPKLNIRLDYDVPDDIFDEPTPEPEPDYAQYEAKMLAMFAEQERRKTVFICRDGKEYKLPLTPEQVDGLSMFDRAELRDRSKDTWRYKTQQYHATEAEMLAAAVGTSPCPSCEENRKIPVIRYSDVTGMSEPSTYGCWCRDYREIQAEFDKLVAPRYRGYDFRTIKPSTECGLPLKQQAKEWSEIFATLQADRKLKAADPKNFKPHNFVLSGKKGMGKTTTASMIAREAIWRDYWNPKFEFIRITRWVWVVDAQELFDQQTMYSTTRLSENPAPEPLVTPRRVELAASIGCTPTLILEELDKGKLTESRASFLFTLINAFDKNNGQLIVTTNRTLDRFSAFFQESDIETVRTSGEPILRRLLQNDCIVKEWF
jgi:DNA replication protein DnaC